MKRERKITMRSDCPISFGLDIFGDKWTLLILRDIMFYGRTRFSDFAPHEHISTNILADRLRTLEDMGLVTKRRDEVLKNQYVYAVTEKGADLLPVLVELMLWGFQYDTQTPAGKAFLNRIASERRHLADEVLAALEQGTFMEYRRSNMGVTLA